MSKRRKLATQVVAPATVQIIVGRHPTLGNLHRLTRYPNGDIRIQRKDLRSRNPRTGQIERTKFPDILEKFANHQWLWHTIDEHRIFPIKY